jgi:hypothetical protein
MSGPTGTRNSEPYTLDWRSKSSDYLKRLLVMILEELVRREDVIPPRTTEYGRAVKPS